MSRKRQTLERVFLRAVRNAVRSRVRETHEVPSLMCAVSEGATPRKLKVSTRLDLLGDSIDVRAIVQQQIEAHGSYFAAVGGLTPDRQEFVISVVSLEGTLTCTARVDVRTGLGGWEDRGELSGGVEFIRAALRKVPRP